jgi:hypothetical protein
MILLIRSILQCIHLILMNLWHDSLICNTKLIIPLRCLILSSAVVPIFVASWMYLSLIFTALLPPSKIKYWIHLAHTGCIRTHKETTPNQWKYFHAFIIKSYNFILYEIFCSCEEELLLIHIQWVFLQVWIHMETLDAFPIKSGWPIMLKLPSHCLGNSL